MPKRKKAKKISAALTLATLKQKLAALDWRITVVTILVIGGLEGYALALGRDGYLFSTALVAIAGLGGFKLRR